MTANSIIKFFIVEDDNAFRSILKDILRKVEEGFLQDGVSFEIESFFSIAEAQARIYTMPDIVLLDYYIVDDNFNQVTSDKLLQDIIELDKNIKVIIVSGEEKPDIVKNLKALGAAYYISKNPRTIARIIPTIKSLVRKKLAEK
jgi:DNA-binding NarL/FixJ family response regulator